MFGFRYFTHAGPTDYVAVYRHGLLKQQGPGLTFLAGPRTTAAIVPMNVQSIPFTAVEVTRDDQSVTVAGEMVATFRPTDALGLYDFSIEIEGGTYRNDGIEAAHALLRVLIPAAVRQVLQTLTLREAVKQKGTIEQAVTASVLAMAETQNLGMDIGVVTVHRVAPANAELGRALEAEERERMLAAGDRATAQRRLEVAESDRRIKLYEAESAQALEADRAKLVEAKVANQLKEAEGEAEANKTRLAVYANADPAVLFALALQRMAEGHIGELTITPELLGAFSRIRG